MVKQSFHPHDGILLRNELLIYTATSLNLEGIERKQSQRLLYISIYMTSLKREKNSVRDQYRGCQGLYVGKKL